MKFTNKKILVSVVALMGLTGMLGVTYHYNVHADAQSATEANAMIQNDINNPNMNEYEFKHSVDYWEHYANERQTPAGDYSDNPSDWHRAHPEGYGNPVTDWKGDLKDDVTGENTIGYNPKTDVDYSNTAPNWLKGYWSSETYYKDDGGYNQYQEFGVGANKYGFSDEQNEDENNYLFNSTDGIVGIHKINRNRIYCYSKAKDYTGYWDRVSKSEYNKYAGDDTSSTDNPDEDTSNNDNNTDENLDNEDDTASENTNSTNDDNESTTSDGNVIASQDSPYVIQYGKDELAKLGKANNHSQSYYGWVGKELCDSDDEAAQKPGEATNFSKKAAWWIASHGLAPLLKDDSYWGSFENNHKIMNMIKNYSKKSSRHLKNTHHKHKVRKQHKIMNDFYYNRKKYGRKGYHDVYTTGFNKRKLRSKFKRSNNKKLLKRSGFRDLRKYNANFIFNKYAPNDKRAVVPKRLNFKYTAWLSGKFGKNHPNVYAYVGKYWIKHK